ncbi:hypothetical protein [Woodsholea maritima]|uniref:hypothetical protein n=1 Tax=Woodsholea maritima TaxID=240237 RepID=UPI0003730BF2|nr:hypothetical protein [Woodsholea maritima]
MLRKVILAACLTFMGPASLTFAQTTQRDLEVVARALKFLEGAGGSERVMVIAHDGDGAGEAANIAGLLSGGVQAGSIRLTGRAIGEDVGALSGANAVFLVGNAKNNSALIAAAQSQGIVTISTDLACVTAHICMLGVQSAPNVRILANRASLAEAGIRFEPAFVMLVEEI